ncbi:vitellogenin, putative [Ixodes scapularis]|uniref:Vitellogenin, putative n=1 Tax=Ixodes scapularis TaxID=6945 RepID=B7Q7E5_IXOSC|nr:vitellogenin, putative [Ixodes scapularis]|eukprot:XP_002403966.1 vitellogenin, putative [Ixodes scapularis]
MRVLVALAFVAAVAAAVEVPQVLPELLFEPNQEYLYKYRTAVSLSLPLKATHATGEETYGLLSVVVKEASGTGRSLVLQLLNVTSTLYDKEVEDQTEPVPGVYHQPLPVFESYQTGPVVLKLVDHSVESLEVPVGVPEEVVNLYRGLASVLTLSNPSYKKVPFTKDVPLTLKDDVVVYKVYEDDLVGTCETVYNVLSSPHDEYVLNFTKTKNYHKCVGKTTVFQHVDYEHSGCPHACLKHQPKALSETLEPELSDYVDPYGGGCPTETHLKNDLAESFLTVHYNVSLHQEVGVLEEVKAIDKKVLTSGKQQLVSTSVLHLELLLKTTPFTAVGPLEDVKTYTNLSYVYPKQHYSWHGQLYELEHLSLYGPVDTVEARTAVRGLLDQLAGLLVLDDLEVKDDYADLVSQLLTAVNVLKEYDLELLLQTVVPLENVKVVSEKEYIERKLLLDVLSLAGTDAAAKTVLRLLLEQKLTLVEAVHVLTSLQTSLVKPSTEVLDLLLDLATSGVLEKDRLLYSTAYLTLAKVVSKHCHLYDTTSHVPYGKMLKMNEVDAIKKRPPHLPTYRAMKTYRPRISGRQYQETETEEPQYTGVPVTCTSQDYLKYVQALVQKLNEAKEFHQVTVLVHALTQLQHPEALKALVPVVLGKHHLCQATLPEEEQSESCQYLRLVTLYALRHSVKHHAAELQPLAQTVYFNTDEDYELRNAALVLLMASHPPEPVLARVVLTLQKELNLQVASFTYSTLFAYANATVPVSRPSASTCSVTKAQSPSSPKPSRGSVARSSTSTRRTSHSANSSTSSRSSVYTSAVSSVVTVTPFTKVVAGVRTLAKTRLTLPYDFAFQYSSVNHTVALTVRPRYTKFFTHHTKSVTYTTPAVLYTPPQRAVMATMSVLYSQAKPFEFKKTFGHEALGLGLHVQGLSSHPDLHVPFSFQRYTKEKGLLGAFVDVLTNPWHVARKWEARVVRSTVHPVDEYKLTFRWKTTLNQTDRTDFVEEVLPAPYQSTKYPTTRYGYPEDLETPIYEEHYKRAVGELPPYFDFYQVLQEVVAATEVTSTPLAHYVTPFLNDVQNTTYGYFVEFVLGALGPLETKVLTGHALLGHTFDKALKLSQLYVNKVNSPYEVKVHSALLKTAVPSPFKSYAVDKKEQSLYFTSVLDVLTEESDTQKYTLQVKVHSALLKTAVPSPFKSYAVDKKEQSLYFTSVLDVLTEESDTQKYTLQVPGLLKNVTHSLLQYAKVLFYNKLVTDYDVETRSTFTHLEGELVFEDHPTGKTTANLTLYTPLEEKLQFVRLNWFKYLKPTVAIGFLDTVAGVLRRSYPTPTCLVSPTYLKTFDNVTVLLKPYLRDDTYVVARHVLDEPDFYVLTEFQGETQLVKLILRNQTLLELTPPRDGKTFEVLVNGTSLYVEPLKSHVLQYTQNYTSQVFLYVTEHQEVGPTLWVTVRDLGLKFAYDGSKLIFKVLSPKYKGRVLGLCGDLDGEYVDELVTPELCVLTEEEDFVQTYSLKGLESTVGLYKCPLGVTLRGVGYPSYPRIQKTFARINPIEVEKEIEIPKLIGTPECVTERRKTIYKDGKVCISTKKVTACQRRCKPVATEKVTLEFVCLNEKHPVAKRLLKDIQGKRNVRLPTDIPTFNEDVEIPTDCVPEV